MGMKEIFTSCHPKDDL